MVNKKLNCYKNRATAIYYQLTEMFEKRFEESPINTKTLAEHIRRPALTRAEYKARLDKAIPRWIEFVESNPEQDDYNDSLYSLISIFQSISEKS